MTVTKEFIQSEITALDQKVERLRQDLVLADGARQAFKFVLARLDEPEIVLEPAS